MRGVALPVVAVFPSARRPLLVLVRAAARPRARAALVMMLVLKESLATEAGGARRVPRCRWPPDRADEGGRRLGDGGLTSVKRLWNIHITKVGCTDLKHHS